MIKVTVRKEWHTDPETTVYEGDNIWSALSVIRFEQIKGENRIIALYPVENKYGAIEVMSNLNKNKPDIGIGGSAHWDLLNLLFAPPSKWEMESAEHLAAQIGKAMNIPQVFTNEETQEDNRSNEIIFKDGHFHIFTKEKPIEQIAEELYGGKE